MKKEGASGTHRRLLYFLGIWGIMLTVGLTDEAEVRYLYRKSRILLPRSPSHLFGRNHGHFHLRR